MPGFRAHHIFGDQVVGKLPAGYASTCIKRHRCVYNLGLQGPDLFFYAVPSHLVHKENIGATMHHEKTTAFVKALIRAQKMLRNPEYRAIAEAYICGFIGHYTLDTNAHPYIHYRSKKTEAESKTHVFGSHLQLETDLDAVIMKHYQHKHIADFSCADAISLSKSERFAVAILLHFAIRKVYPQITLHIIEIFHAIWSTRHLFRIIVDPSGSKKAWLRKFDQRVFGYSYLSGIVASDHIRFRDPANLRHKLWKNPWDTQRISREDFFSVFERAQVDYLRRLNLFISRDIDGLCEDLGSLSYDTGLPATLQ